MSLHYAPVRSTLRLSSKLQVYMDKKVIYCFRFVCSQPIYLSSGMSDMWGQLQLYAAVDGA